MVNCLRSYLHHVILSFWGHISRSYGSSGKSRSCRSSRSSQSSRSICSCHPVIMNSQHYHWRTDTQHQDLKVCFADNNNLYNSEQSPAVEHLVGVQAVGMVVSKVFPIHYGKPSLNVKKVNIWSCYVKWGFSLIKSENIQKRLLPYGLVFQKVLEKT